jgi:hypothetical protein
MTTRWRNSMKRHVKIHYGLVLRRLVLRRFTFTTLVESDRALLTCGASLSQLERHFSTLCASRSFPVCTCFFFFYFSAVFLVDCDFSTHDVRQKDRGGKKGKFKTVEVTFFLDVFWTTAWAFFNKIKSDLIDFFFNYLCNFLYT